MATTKEDYQDVLDIVTRERNIIKARSQRVVKGSDLQRRMAVGGYYANNI